MKKFSAQPYWILLYRLELDRKKKEQITATAVPQKFMFCKFWMVVKCPAFIFGDFLEYHISFFHAKCLFSQHKTSEGRLKKNLSAFWSILNNYFSGFCNIQVLFQCEMKAQFKLAICPREVLSSSLPYPWQIFLINWYHFAQSWYWQQ